MLRTSMTGGVLVLGTALATGVAVATPPHGAGIFERQARGHAVGTAVANVKPGSGAYVGDYSLAPGAGSGWRAQPGMSFLAVTDGALSVVQAKGCGTHEYKAGEVAVLPAGTYAVSNAGSEAANFVGFFDNLGKTAGTPLVDGKVAKAAKGCAAGALGTGMYGAASTGLSATEVAKGLFSAAPADSDYHLTAKDTTVRATVPDGGDIAIVSLSALPGTATGWYKHAPGIAILTKGTLGVWEATKDGCAKVEETKAGDAVSHLHHDLHYSVVEGDEPLEGVLIYWAMGSERVPASMGPKQASGLTDFAEANDFTAIPPPGCTTV